MSKNITDREYGKAVNNDVTESPFPELPYRPSLPADYRPGIGIVGCGGIIEHHLKAYQIDGLEVVHLCDTNEHKAIKRRDEFYPMAKVTTDLEELLENPSVEIVDIATHPSVRYRLIERALQSGRHVLSQKPFVLDLEDGKRLSAIAQANGVKLAVNQNGRWAPYFSFLLRAREQKLLGELQSIDMTLSWDHTWIKGTAFEKIEHIMLYDFAIHWLDICACLMGERMAKSVFATETHVSGQELKSPMSTSVIIDYGTSLATLSFHGNSRFCNHELIRVSGDKGSIIGSGPITEISELEANLDGNHSRGKVAGNWFPDGMRGTMGELLHSIAEDRIPFNSPESAMRGLQLCFAAIESARIGKPVEPHTITVAGPGCKAD